MKGQNEHVHTMKGQNEHVHTHLSVEVRGAALAEQETVPGTLFILWTFLKKSVSISVGTFFLTYAMYRMSQNGYEPKQLKQWNNLRHFFSECLWQWYITNFFILVFIRYLFRVF
jgi:hypothetical protein